VFHGVIGLALLAGLPACRGESKAQATPPPPVEVGVVTLESQSVLLTTELPGRTSPYEVSEVRPQVSGVIRARLFTEGQLVEKGQTLYQIDDRLYRAAAAQARANLASARAQNETAQAKAERYRYLQSERAISAQEYSDARAGASAAAAAIEQASAALDTATINLRFTQVPAPIAGRIGRSLVTTGALVTNGQASPLTTIQRLDPMFVDLQQSSTEMLALRRSLSRQGISPASADVHLLLPDGDEYEHVGTLQFAEATVDPNTGSVTLRARFDNPDCLLLPGMYVRAIVGQSERKDALLAPQAGVTRDPKGNASVLVVGPDDKVAQKLIETSRAIGDQWLVERGLEPGARLIVEGTDKVRPGQVVRAVPAGQRAGAASPNPSAAPGAAPAPGR
jgi:membrane fusion protein (multidrug efflux system)